MKKSEFRTDGIVVSQTFTSVGEDGRAYKQTLRAASHKKHSPWTDCLTCLAKHHKQRKLKRRMARASAR